MRIRSRRHMWFAIATITTGSILISELCILAVWFWLGPTAFVMPALVLVGGIVPFVVAVPISYVICNMGWLLSNTHSQLRHLADTDSLTGLANRRYFFEHACKHLALCEEANEPVSLLIIDADDFKNINDTYGHTVGDEALVAISDTLRANFRARDLVCRMGGEEFAVLLPGITKVQAYPLAERLVQRVSGEPLSTGKAIIEYSISCGLADSSTSYDLEVLYKAADDAMYIAKREGRNRVAPLAASGNLRERP